MNGRAWQATVSGGLFGLLVGSALQIGREIRHETFVVHGTDFLKPYAIPVLVSLVFSGLGAFVYVVWSRLKS